MRRHNGRLFRIARAILKDDADAEDALQDAYLDAYRHMDEFRGGSQLATWLTRIVINQALVRLRKQKRERVVVPFARRRSSRGSDQPVELADDERRSRRPTPRCEQKSAACSSAESTSCRSPSAPSSSCVKSRT